MSAETLIKVEGVSKKFCRNLKKSLWYGMTDLSNELLGRSIHKEKLRPDEFWAVKDVSFELKRGECLGLIGHNGAGKSTLLKMLNGLIKPDEGKITMKGRIGALIELNAGFNPILTGRENIYIYGSILGFTKKEIDDKYDAIVEFSEIDHFMEMPVQSYSSGMKVRLGFAVAAQVKPDVLIIDEVLAVGDTGFRNKCFNEIGKMLSNATVIFVSHNESQIKRICDKCIFLYKGLNKYAGDTETALKKYINTLKFAEDDNKNMRQKWHHKKSISSIEVFIKEQEVNWKGYINIHIKFYSSEEMSISKAFVQIYKSNISVSHTEDVFFKSYMNSKINIGVNRYILKIGPVYLIDHKYEVSLALFTNNGKVTIIHSRNIGSFRVKGTTGIGPPVRHPTTFKKIE